MQRISDRMSVVLCTFLAVHSYNMTPVPAKILCSLLLTKNLTTLKMNASANAIPANLVT